MMKLKDTIQTVAWGMHHFGGIVTGGSVKLRDIKAAQSKGLVESIGEVAVCDGDGFTVEPERYREGFALTQCGIDLFREVDPETAERWNLEPQTQEVAK